MTHLRAIVRILSLLVLTVASYAAIRGGIVLRRLEGDARLRYFIERYQRWCRRVSRLMGMRIRRVGPVPEAPYLLVSNHVSYTDILALGVLVAPVFVAKAEIARWPFLGVLVRDAGAVFIDRVRVKHIPSVIEEVERRFESGFGMALFPEGTTSDGRQVAAFRPSLLEVAVRSGRGVTPAALLYRTPPGCRPAGEAVAWVGTATLVPHLYGLLRLPWFEVLVTFSGKELRGEDRKHLAETARVEVARLLEAGRSAAGTGGEAGT